MSDDAAHAHAHEIIIVKHHGGHEDGHHGGVWKIAFADFMTAMMAFFLVMWLLSANDKTKVTIAKYFNPVELVDSTPQPPGLNDPKKGDPSVQRESKRPVSTHEGKDGKSPNMADGGGAAAANPIGEAEAIASHDEAELTRDPYAVLAEIANKANKAAPEKTKDQPLDAQRGVGSQGHKGGEAFRDPFDPAQAGSPEAAGPPAASTPAEMAAADHAALPPAPAAPPMPPAASAPAAASLPTAPSPSAPEAVAPDEPAPADEKPVPPAALRTKIAALGKAADASPGGAPKLDVKQTGEGLLISLTDSADFSMFPISSARPAGKTVTLIEKIGVLLKSQKGNITIRGFTDSRPFRSATYDNWRLSTTRAHMAHYMLVLGGVTENRIDRIEGYADHRPKNPKNPDAAENRRIEILLRDPTP